MSRCSGGPRHWAFVWARALLLGALVVAVPLDAQGAPPPTPKGPAGESQEGGAPASYLGRTLEDALLTLQTRGLRLVFTDRVVRPDLRVTAEPRATEPRAVLDELLRPHGLQVREGRGNRLVIVPVPAGEGGGGHDPAPGSQPRSPGARLPPLEMPTTSETIEVHSEPPGILGERISALVLDRLTLQSLPSLLEDPLRPLVRLPGTTGNDVSAEIRVRGSHADEVMIRLDGQEIPEPYHLRDFNNALSILAPEAVGGAELYTGGFPVEYGDRTGGVLDLTSREARSRRRLELGLSFYHLEASGSGRLPSAHGDRGSWLAAFRAGSLELAAEVASLDREPEFADLFGKVDLDLTPSQSLRGNVLLSQDELSSFEPDRERFRTAYTNRYGWLTHGHLVSPGLFLEARGSLLRIERDRIGFESHPEDGRFDLHDDRLYFVTTLAHEGEARVLRSHELKWGLESRWLEVDYDYASDFELTDPLAAIRDRPAAGADLFERRFQGRQYGIYLADHWRATPSLGIELGIRFDENTLLDDELVNPRLQLEYRLGTHTSLRGAWGVFHQTQRVYELQVEDGEREFFPAEEAEHRILGFEHVFAGHALGTDASRPLTLRGELYERRIHNPRPRWENLFEPVSLVPELEPDRVRIAPDSGRSRGVELVLSGGWKERLHGFLSYAYSEVKDRIDGRNVPRGVDQPRTVELHLAWRAPWKWDLDFAWTHHTGWPTTSISARLGEGGEIVPELGPLYGERLPDYHRLDLGARRRFTLPRGALELALAIQNLAASDNLRGFEISFEKRPDGTVEVIREKKDWGPPIPSVSLRWRF